MDIVDYWEPWFAWRPVYIWNKDYTWQITSWVWCKYIERRRTYLGQGDWGWEYRIA